MTVIHVTDHAVLRYLERAHGLDVEAVKRHIAGRLVNGARLGATGVTIEKVKFVLKHSETEVCAVTTIMPDWPSRR